MRKPSDVVGMVFESFKVKCLPIKVAVISSDHIDDDDPLRREVEFLVMSPTLADFKNSPFLIVSFFKQISMLA